MVVVVMATMVADFVAAFTFSAIVAAIGSGDGTGAWESCKVSHRKALEVFDSIDDPYFVVRKVEHREIDGETDVGHARQRIVMQVYMSKTAGRAKSKETRVHSSEIACRSCYFQKRISRPPQQSV